MGFHAEFPENTAINVYPGSKDPKSPEALSEN